MRELESTRFSNFEARHQFVAKGGRFRLALHTSPAARAGNEAFVLLDDSPSKTCPGQKKSLACAAFTAVIGAPC